MPKVGALESQRLLDELIAKYHAVWGMVGTASLRALGAQIRALREGKGLS